MCCGTQQMKYKQFLFIECMCTDKRIHLFIIKLTRYIYNLTNYSVIAISYVVLLGFAVFLSLNLIQSIEYKRKLHY